MQTGMKNYMHIAVAAMGSNQVWARISMTLSTNYLLSFNTYRKIQQFYFYIFILLHSETHSKYEENTNIF